MKRLGYTMAWSAMLVALLLAVSRTPVMAIEYPLTVSDVARAIAFGQAASTASALLDHKLEWYVPCTSFEPDASTDPAAQIPLLIDTPFYLVAQNAFLKRDDAGFVHDSKVYAGLFNKHGMIQVELTVGSEEIERNTDPLFEIHQGGLVVRSRHPKVGDPEATGTLFFRQIDALFDIDKFDVHRDFEVVVSNISDLGVTRRTFAVHPQSMR